MSVNLPHVQTETGDRTRILHIHHNVPGVLATVNGVLGDAGVNIEGQVLSTRGDLGYVITDVGGRLSRRRCPSDSAGCPRRFACASSGESAAAARHSRSVQGGQRGSALQFGAASTSPRR